MRVATGFAVHCFPSVDDEFRRTTEQVIAHTWERNQTTDNLIAEVQAALRERYPEAIVRHRDAQAELGSSTVQTLYAYRDGRAA